MKKKGIELAMNTIIIAVILLIVAVIIIFIFQRYYFKETGFVGEQIEKLKDSDKDNIVDMFDKCPDDPGNTCPCADDYYDEKECEKYKK